MRGGLTEDEAANADAYVQSCRNRQTPRYHDDAHHNEACLPPHQNTTCQSTGGVSVRLMQSFFDRQLDPHIRCLQAATPPNSEDRLACCKPKSRPSNGGRVWREPRSF